MGVHRGGQEGAVPPPGTVHISFHLFVHWPQLTVVSVAIPRRFFFCAAEFSFSSFPRCSLPLPCHGAAGSYYFSCDREREQPGSI
ncbi:hypothetical protein XELAEV_18009038mg [Xenopus laevis]|uniref:Uncharacterized protein n=1 Tax=Xenopus laevis TaxID=8355 RepID=A0A974DU25_XENLA|nr:hypothetical protein XELAEV_18009038mg [Xenopus laevis]